MCLSCLDWYGRRLSPYIVHAGCSMTAFARMRRRMIPHAEGVVAEIGIGSGLNLSYYDPTKVRRLVGIDPDVTMLAMTESRRWSVPFEMDCVEASGEDIPLAGHFADTVVLTYALCTIPRPEVALREIRRILKPTGRLIFIEHGWAQGARVRKWQERLNWSWGRIAGGCHLDRDPVGLVRGAGFSLIDEERSRFPLLFWQLGSHHAGIAAPPAH